MQTVAETPEFSRKIRKLIGDSDYQALIAYLAEHPKAGDLMRGTGGIRKLRWARDGSGKSGGVRVVYYFHDERIPLYLLTIFGKNEKTNISQAERNALAQLVALLTKTAGV
ncbi:Toxin HigB-2 protein [Salinisphaera shabanensis E1L3A]|uniref:Toxin HigB-2 protein n=1 Tax=Salinisphaera shabanensis E1L3A TaxID=1033802 RepID=F7QD69_9GAMM|nr:type II toxin-antitoxin system RelE/ParE family toxin [Salinisphaera shabanensis]ERJ19413.1 Toxin HigB-2 protein [Salinisphaera shabanensis E1L3A]